MIKTLKRSLRSFTYRLRYLGRPIRIGHGTKISRRCTLQIHGGGRITIGRRGQVLDYAMLLSYGGVIEIGDDCSINPFCVLYGLGGLRIGNAVRIAAHTVMIPADHTFEDMNVPICRQPETRLGIVIEDDVWFGVGCRILDGVRIGRGCVIGAGTVVTASLPEFSVAVGVPARVIRNRKSAHAPASAIGR